MFELLELTVRILAYALIGLIPLIYNYYFVKGKVEDIRKAYLTKIKKYEPIMPLVEAEIHGPQFTSNISRGFKTTVNSQTISVKSPQVDLSRGFEPIVVTSSLITSNPQNLESNTPQNHPYIVLVLDPQVVRNPDTIKDIVSRVEDVLPTWQGRVNSGYTVKEEV